MADVNHAVSDTLDVSVLEASAKVEFVPEVDPIVFDTDISRGARGGAMFSTVVVSADAGFEQRVVAWENARLKWNVGHTIQNREHRAYLIKFFRARKGRARGFLFHDWSDYYVGKSWSGDTLSHDADEREVVGTGDNVEVSFQLTKTYDDGHTPEVRKITRPKSGSVKVYIDGVEEVSGWSIDYTTGILTFDVAPGVGEEVAWGGEFYVPARFDTDQMVLTLDGTSGDWADIPIVEIREPEDA